MARVAAALTCCALVLASCGDDDEAVPAPAPPAADELAVAIAVGSDGDPLRAEDRASQFVLRQAFEPLVGPVEPPFARAGVRKGLALGFRPNGDSTVWTARLRRGVRFSDGASFNASAVAFNARRWVEEARDLVPELVAADAPRTDRVRLILAEPVEDLPDELAHPRLGIVSPDAFRVRRNGRIDFDSTAAAGTGPFTIARRTAGTVVIERNAGWWGSAFDLGPVISRVTFTVERDPGSRLALLEAGQVQIADELGRATRADLGELRRDPLAEPVRTPGSLMGVERSVRGLAAERRGTPLSGVWLTTVGQEVPIG